MDHAAELLPDGLPTDSPDAPSLDLGVDPARITTTVDVADVVDRKRAALAAHATQVDETSFFLAMPVEAFRMAFGYEWFIRRGAPPGTRDDNPARVVTVGPVPMSWVLLGFGCGAAALTVPAVRPVRIWLLLFPAFLVSLVVGELPGWGLAVTVGGAAALVGLGAAHGWAGAVGLAAAVAAAANMSRQVAWAHRAAGVVDENLHALDGRHEPPPRRSLADRLNPFRLGDRHVVRVDQARYAPGAGRRHLLDVYRGRDRAERRAPVLLQIHGGAWVGGGKRTQGRLLMNRLARAPAGCASRTTTS